MSKLVDLDHDFLNNDNKQARLKHIQQLMQTYCECFPQYSYHKGMPNQLNNAYWAIMSSHVKPFFNDNGNTSRIDRHKIISILEFAIIGLKPIFSENNPEESKIKINVDFACTLAWQIYRTFFHNQYTASPSNYDLAKFFEEHKKFLEMNIFNYKKGEIPPQILSNLIFSNAATWFGVDKYVKAVNNKT